LEGLFCIQALNQALHRAQPEIFNTEQGAQFTALAFTDILEAAHIRISLVWMAEAGL
jgi:putative transposase